MWSVSLSSSLPRRVASDRFSKLSDYVIDESFRQVFDRLWIMKRKRVCMLQRSGGLIYVILYTGKEEE